MTPAELKEAERFLTAAERRELNRLIDIDLLTAIWRPLPGPQLMAFESDADVIGFGGAAGGGKGLALDTPIPTPAGWSTMGALRVGDTVFDDRGARCLVTATSEVSHRPCFRLTFDDGSTLVADDVHRWVTFSASELAALTRADPAWRAARRASRPSRAKSTTSQARRAALAKHNASFALRSVAPAGTMRDTAELACTLRLASGRANHAIRVACGLDTPNANLPIPPYTLGAWLGDGSSRNGQLTGEDAGILERIEAEGFVVRHYTWDRLAHNILGLKVRLRAAGLLQNKHIPLAYLRASIAQRMALLQGLMDTDGHAAPDGGCEFDGVNEALVRGVFDLVRSLGIKATLQQGKAKLNGRVVSDKWRVKFTTSLPVFGLARKQDRLGATRRTTAFRYLVACEPVESVPTRCIAVDSESRQYLAGDALIPTHNTDLAIGKGLMQHRNVFVVRKNGTEHTGMVDRLTELLGTRDGFSGKDGIWRDAGPRKVQIEFGSLPNPKDEEKYRGRPHDLVIYDEATSLQLLQVQFLMAWNRTTTPGQRCQTLLTFNPPNTAEGRWVIEYFAPWLDKKYANPAAPGELRWFATVEGRDTEMPDARQFVLVDGKIVYDFDPVQFKADEVVQPKSRTFIPSRVTDNPYLVGTNYMSTLQALPEPLRSQMLRGDFQAGIQDDAMQVVPTEWVEIAMARWQPRSPKGEMMACGVDVARGGEDESTLARRHKVSDLNALWFDEALVYPGAQTPNGPVLAGLVVAAARDGAPIPIDVIGVGASPFDFLRAADQPVYGINVSETANGTDRSGRLRFFNTRSMLWWRMREALDPAHDTGIALPNDRKLLAELCAPKWELSGSTIKVEPRDEIVKRIGRSPDRATAYILALMDIPKMRALDRSTVMGSVLNYDPLAQLGGHDPFGRP